MICLWAGCPGDNPETLLFAQLEQEGGREQAIDQLLVLIKEAPAGQRPAMRKRVAYALTEAYRVDKHRGAIVSALALLKAREGEVVFAAALSDYQRGGEYFEAAIRSARLLGEMEIKARGPELVKVLEQILTTPRPDRNTWLERTLILSLDKLGHRKAVPVLIKVLDGDPVSQDFYLNKMAARALGKLGDPAAIPGLVRSLGATRHGLLLFEESRRALCRIGPPALLELKRVAALRDRRGLPGDNAAGALRLLGDLGDPGVLPDLKAWSRGKADDRYRLVLGETLFRLRSSAGKEEMAQVLDQVGAPLTARGEAARLLGLYGAPGDLGQRPETACKDQGPASGVLCWRLALAHTRLCGPGGAERLDRLIAARQDTITAQYLTRYRPRLKVPDSCKGDRGCVTKHLTAQDWRVRERAVLELGRGAGLAVAEAGKLAARYVGEHDQVRQAILLSLERLELSSAEAGELLKALPTKEKKSGVKSRAAVAAAGEASPALQSRLLCLRERLGRATTTGKRTEKE